MSDMNTVSLIGRLTKDAEMTTKQSGLSICSFSIAVDRQRKKQEEGEEPQWIKEASFIDLSIFGQRAQVLFQYLVKGKQVAVTGHLEQQRWEQDGKKRSRLTVRVDQLQLLSGGQTAGDSREKQEPGEELNQDILEYTDEGTLEDIPF